MTDPNVPPVVARSELLADVGPALDSLRETLSNLPASEVRAPNVDMLSMVIGGLELSEAAMRDLDVFERVFKDPPLDEAKGLRTATLAMWGAQLELERRIGLKEERRKDAVALSKLAARLRREFLSAAEWIWADDPKVRDFLAEVRKGRGYRDRANDLNALAGLFRERMNEVTAKTSITPEQVDELARVGVQLLDMLQPVDEDPAIAAAKDLRNRAYVYQRGLVEEVRAAGKYVWRNDPSRYADYE